MYAICANSHWRHLGYAALVVGGVGGAAVLVGMLLQGDLVVDVVKRAASIPEENPEGLERFVNAANKLITPFLVAMVAVTPIAMIVGAGALMIGKARGLLIIAGAVAALVVAGSAKGIVE